MLSQLIFLQTAERGTLERWLKKDGEKFDAQELELLLDAKKFKEVVVLLDVPHNFPEKEEVAFLVDLANDVRSPSLFQTMILII